MNNRAGNGTVPAPSQCAINTTALISYGREGENLGIVLYGSKGSPSEAVARRQHGGMRSYHPHLFLNFRFPESELQNDGHRSSNTASQWCRPASGQGPAMLYYLQTLKDTPWLCFCLFLWPCCHVWSRKWSNSKGLGNPSLRYSVCRGVWMRWWPVLARHIWDGWDVSSLSSGLRLQRMDSMHKSKIQSKFWGKGQWVFYIYSGVLNNFGGVNKKGRNWL